MVDSALVRKMQKAKQYAYEKADRVKFIRFEVEVKGNHSVHYVRYEAGQWLCDCAFFRQRGRCSHTMAMEYILEGMLED